MDNNELERIETLLKASGLLDVHLDTETVEEKGFVGQHGIFNMSPTDHCGLSKDDLEMVVVKNGDWALAQ